VNVDDTTRDDNGGDARDVDVTDGVEIDKATTPEGEPTQGRRTGGRNLAVRVKVVPAVVVLVLLLSAGLAAWLYFSQYRPDKQTDTAAAQAAVTAAREGTVALLSYKPDTLDQDFTTAKSHLSGDFLTYYEKFTRDIVTPAARQKAVSTTAQVVGAAMSDLQPRSAVVMVFVNQTTTSKDRPEPAMTASTVLVSMTKADGRWLITSFDPV
jgi:Mce-associated membrane protein